LNPVKLRWKKKARSVIFRSDDLCRDIGQVTIRPVFSYSQSSSLRSSADAPDDADFDQALGAIESVQDAEIRYIPDPLFQRPLSLWASLNCKLTTSVRARIFFKAEQE
jgi:hypothetical protein